MLKKPVFLSGHLGFLCYWGPECWVPVPVLHPQREPQPGPENQSRTCWLCVAGAGWAHTKGSHWAELPAAFGSLQCSLPCASSWEGHGGVSPLPPFFFHHHHLLPTCWSGQNRIIFSHLLKSSPSDFLLLLHSFFAGRGNSLVKPLDTRIVACSFPGSQIALKLPSEWQFLSSILLKHVFYTYTEKC